MPQAKDGGRETEKSLPQSNAVHLTALPSRGTRFCLRLGAPNKIDRFAHKCSLFPPPAAVTFVARRGRKRRGQAPALLCKLYFVRVGNGLDCSVKLYQITRANTVRPYGLRDKPKFVILRDSEGSPIAQNKNIRNEILRLTAQNDNRAGEHSSPLRVGNNRRCVLQNYIKIYGRAWKPAPTV